MKAHAADDYQRIEKVILFLEKNAVRRPGLREAARTAEPRRHPDISGFQ